jgi:hypothetical protein
LRNHPVPFVADAAAEALVAHQERPLRAQRNRPLRARTEAPVPTGRVTPRRSQRERPLRVQGERSQRDRSRAAAPDGARKAHLRSGTTPPTSVVPVPAGLVPVLAIDDMRKLSKPDRTPQAEQAVRSRRPGRPRKTMPDSRTVPPEVAAADEEAWRAWLSSSEPAEDRLEQLDADLARVPRRLSRWVDAAATGRRSRGD